MKPLSKHLTAYVALLCAAALLLTSFSLSAVALPDEEIDLMVWGKIGDHDNATITEIDDGSWLITASSACSIEISGCGAYDASKLKYLHLGIVSDVPFTVAFFDGANNKWITTAGDFYPDFGGAGGQPAPAGTYTKAMWINGCYTWDGSGLPASVQINSIYIELISSGKLVLSTLKLSESNTYDGQVPTLPHSHSLTAVVGKDATCTENGNKAYWSCSCGKYFSDNNAENEIQIEDTVLTALGHDFTEKVIDTEHLKSEATCTSPAVYYYCCIYCHEKSDTLTFENGDALDHDFTGKVIDAEHLKSEATCTSPAVYYYDCRRCDEISTTHTFENGDTLDHDFSGGYDGYDDDYHWHICKRDNCDETDANEAHSGGAASYSGEAICDVCGHPYGGTSADTTAPTGVISISDSRWNGFSGSITFDLFFKEAKTVTVTANDTESGVAKIEYLLSATAFDTETDVTGTWQDITAAKQFSLSVNTKQFIYVRITDKDGNTSIINSEGVVIYSDSTVTPQDAVFDKNTAIQSDVAFTMDLKGNTLKDIKNGTQTLVKDTDYTVDGNTVTVKKPYLASQNIGNISLAFSFCPMGVITDAEILTASVNITDGITTETETKPDGTTVVTKKDSSGNVLEFTETQPDGSSTYTQNNYDGTSEVTKKDSAGNVTEKTVTNADGSKTVTTFNIDGSSSTKKYDSAGNEMPDQDESDGTSQTDTPPTGDSPYLPVYIALLLVSGGALAVLVIAKKRAVPAE